MAGIVIEILGRMMRICALAGSRQEMLQWVPRPRPLAPRTFNLVLATLYQGTIGRWGRGGVNVATGPLDGSPLCRTTRACCFLPPFFSNSTLILFMGMRAVAAHIPPASQRLFC